VIPPPVQGNVYDTFDPPAANVDAQACAVAWWAYRAFAGLVLDGALLDMNNLQGVPM
jgi:hypothetical protein